MFKVSWLPMIKPTHEYTQIRYVLPVSNIQTPRLWELAQHVAAPLCLFDVEGSGCTQDGRGGIVELAMLHIAAAEDPSLVINRFNPETMIGREAYNAHGISAKDVVGAPTFATVAPYLAGLFRRSVMIGFGSKTSDVPLLLQNIKHYDAPTLPPRRQLDLRDIWRAVSGQGKVGVRGTLQDVAGHYSVPVRSAHAAGNDVMTTALLLEAMIYAHGVTAAIEKIRTYVPPKPPRSRLMVPQRLPVVDIEGLIPTS
jgi:DNA polymerase III epsilon subunit-like protein